MALFKLLGFGMIVVILVFGYLFLSGNISSIEKINCDTISPVYFKPGEKIIAGEAANKYNIISVIPEENFFIARTEVLKCPNFDYKNYINVQIKNKSLKELLE